MDKHMKAREQIEKITEQQGKLHRGRNVSDAMREAEELGNQYRHSPQWQQDLSREQVNKRRHALSELVRTNRDPRQDVDSQFPPNIGRPLPPEQLAAARMRGADPARYAPGRRQAPQISLATPRVRSAPPPSASAASRPARGGPASARAPSSTASLTNSSRESHRRLQRRLHRRLTGGTGV